MKIAYIRGDYLSSWEISNSLYLAKHHDFTLFLGKKPIYRVDIPASMKVVSLFSPADLNFGKVSRYKMAILNRMFVDAHILFDLEEALKGFDIAYVSETYYGFTHQALEAKKMGYIKTVISHASENTPFNNEGIWGRKRFKDQAIREMDKFVAITKGAEDVLVKEGCDPKKITRLYPGVDQTIFKPQTVSNFKGLKKNSNIKLLFIGRLVKEKGIIEVLKIFDTLSKKHKNLEIIIADTGPLASYVENFTKINQNAHYLGRLPYSELSKLYSMCDIYLHYSIGSPTWVEQYGFTLLEAMSSGLPVMGLDKGSVKELVSDGGFVVDPQKYSSILEKLVTNPKLRKQTSQKALTLAKKRYNADKHGKDLEKVFKSSLLRS